MQIYVPKLELPGEAVLDLHIYAIHSFRKGLLGFLGI
jgi:hypothetical protein